MPAKTNEISEMKTILKGVLKAQETLTEQLQLVLNTVKEHTGLLEKFTPTSMNSTSINDSALEMGSSGYFLDQAFKRGKIPEKAKQTFEAISKLQRQLKRPVRVEDVDMSDLTDSKRPTLYEHVRKLEVANLLTARIGAELGLSGPDTPPNAKYYGVTTHSLYDLSIITQLPDDLSLTAQKMIMLQEGVSSKKLSLKDISEATGRSGEAEQIILEQLYLRNLIEKSGREFFIPKRD